MKNPITPNSVIALSKDQVSCDLSGEVAILDLKAGMYYGLNEIGARIWRLVKEPKTFRELLDLLLDEYEVERKDCEKDVSSLLADMARVGLVEIRA